MSGNSRVWIAFVAMGLLSGGALAGVGLGGWDYYALSAEARPLHPRHDLLRSSGLVGLFCGLAGTALILLNLSYLVRKRLAHVSWLGTLRSWMHFHVWSGLTGAGFIVLHCSFLPRSSLGILALAGLGIVVVTGVVGRYIYSNVPRSLAGRELDREEVIEQLAKLGEQLESWGVEARLLEPPAAPGLDPAKGVLARLAAVVAGNRATREDYRRLQASLRAQPALRTIAPRVLPAARRFYRGRQWLARYTELRALMGSWRFLHRWLAIVMLVLALFHIALAVRFGDLWILGGRG